MFLFRNILNVKTLANRYNTKIVQNTKDFHLNNKKGLATKSSDLEPLKVSA